MNNANLTRTLPDKLALRMMEASHVSGLSQSTLYQLIRSRQLKSVKAAGRRLILRSDLESYLTGLRTGA